MAALNPNTPAAPPPPGVIPNFHAYSRAGTLIATCTAATALMAVFVALRLYSRMRYTKQLASDDYTCIVAAVGSIGNTTATILATRAGFGKHLWDYPVTIFVPSYFKKIYVVQAMYPPVILIVKISLFLLYYRIFSRIPRTRFLIYFGIGSNVVLHLTCWALSLYFCGPRLWQDLLQTYSDYSCGVQAKTLGVVHAAFNIASDIYLLCIPIPVVSRLQLSKKKKIGVIAMFMTGSLGVICGSLNLGYRVSHFRTLDNDFTWKVTPVYITSAVEINVGIMCGCFPALTLILRSIASVLGSSKISRISLSKPRFARWFRLRSDDSPTKAQSTGRKRVTLGSWVNGQGHFLTMKNFFSQQTDDTHSLDLTLRDDKSSTQSSFRGSNSHDIDE